MKCTKCGCENAEDLIFCNNCGKRLVKNKEEPIEPDEPVTPIDIEKPVTPKELVTPKEPITPKEPVTPTKPVTPTDNKTTSDSNLGSTILKCIALFFMGIWLGFCLPEGGGMSALSTLPGAISFAIFRFHNDSMIPLAISLFIGFILSLIF